MIFSYKKKNKILIVPFLHLESLMWFCSLFILLHLFFTIIVVVPRWKVVVVWNG